MHNGFINVDNQKMSKSLHNFFTVRDVANLYGYEPIRYLMISSQYRSPINYSIDIIEQCKASLARLYSCRDSLDFALKNAVEEPGAEDDAVLAKLAERRKQFEEAMDDDLNSPIVISVLFDAVRLINQIYDGQQTISATDLDELRRVMHLYVFDILGLRDDLAGDNNRLLGQLIDTVLDIRMQAKSAKDWATSDRIRDSLTSLGVKVKDRKDGTDWELE